MLLYIIYNIYHYCYKTIFITIVSYAVSFSVCVCHYFGAVMFFGSHHIIMAITHNYTT